MSLHPRRRAARRVRLLSAQWPALVVLTVIWVLLWGDLSWANVLAGLALAVFLVVVFPLPPIVSDGRFRLVPFLALMGRFLSDLVVASFKVAWVALRPGPAPHAAVVQVRLRNAQDVYLTLTAVLSTLVPGSLVIETRRDSGILFLHVLDIEASGGVDGVRRDILALEARVLRALASDEVLARCGMPDGRSVVDTVRTTEREG
ncbi:Na+/H+ antiporter subunit E [Isoptericola cucumis]|uniref:Na+/H+ antiporter subunit E n=1 Tax=Isoptericola cucumis TaxID=1776856 RepID=UPI003208C575